MRIMNEEIDTEVQETDYFSITSLDPVIPSARSSVRLCLTLIAAVSALTGGLAAAWYYRRTLSRLQHADSNCSDSKFGIPASVDDEEL